VAITRWAVDGRREGGGLASSYFAPGKPYVFDVLDFMDELNAAVNRADWQIYVAEQDRILAELAPVTLSMQERDAIKDSFDLWSDWIDNLGEPLGFATYLKAWVHCLKAHDLPPHAGKT
jgi:hypothetical protein